MELRARAPSGLIRPRPWPWRHGLALVGCVASALAAAPAHAGGDSGPGDGLNNADLICRPDQPELDKYGYLRALSLDLRGTTPSLDELAALDRGADVPASLVDQYLGSEEFVGQVVRRHRELLWNNVANADLINFQAFLGTYYSGGRALYWRSTPARLYRGSDVPCDDTPASIQNGVIAYRTDDKGYKREGWVEVHPYWAPGTTIRVCAFDAQAARFTSMGTDCATLDAYSDPQCGCGPDLRWCAVYERYQDLLGAFAEEVEQRIAAVVRGDRPYTELFTGTTAYVNGPMVHFYRHQAQLPGQLSMTPLALAVDRLPEIPYTRKEFVAVDLPAEHGGVLTSPAYLLRFQTYRARANRFFDAFLCQPFQPPPGGLPSPSDACSAEPDLQNRCGCKFCHSLLEPAGAHWGRWSGAGAGYLDPAQYPRVRPDCLECATTGRQCTQDCRARYVTHALTEKEKPYLGTLDAYFFLRPEHEVNVEQGPRLLALSAIVDNRLPSCTARRAAEWLLGRELASEEQAWAAQLARDFVASGYSYRRLVRAVVSSGAYRRVR